MKICFVVFTLLIRAQASRVTGMVGEYDSIPIMHCNHISSVTKVISSDPNPSLQD